jgi:HAD superfamily hydrolase (TIGR01450 family)
MLDLDGVLWRGKKPVPGSADAVARLRDAGHRVGFLTNNSFTSVAELVEKLVDMGVPAEADDICTSGQAAAGLLEPGSTALVVGGPGILEALAAREVEVVDDDREVDAVVVGFDPEFDFAKLTAAFKAVQGGARLVGTNDDATFPTAKGVIPGGGSIVAAVAYASGVTAEIAGKPYQPAARLLKERMGPIAWLIGDRPDTDGGMAVAVGARFGLVLSGVTTSADGAHPEPDAVADDLAAIVSDLAPSATT